MSHSNSENSEWSTGPVFRPLLSSTSLTFAAVGGEVGEDEDDGASPESRTVEISSAKTKTGRISTVFYACLVAVLGSFSIGYVLGFSSPALPDLDENVGKYTRMNKRVYHSMFTVSLLYRYDMLKIHPHTHKYHHSIIM